MNKSLVFLLASTLFFTSCKRQQINKSSNIPSIDSVNVAVESSPIIADSTVIIIPNNPVKVIENEEDKVKIDEIDFKYLKAKAKVAFKGQKESQNVNVDIRMKKDSLIWMNISALGFSVASALFDKGIVKFYDKFHVQ